MRKTLILAAVALPLAACATNPYGSYGSNPLGTILGSIGSLGTGYGTSGYGYGGGFSQAAASACGNYASRYGSVSIRNVQQLDANHAKVFGYVRRGYANEGWDCTFRSDGRITDFDL
jgi:hypothetical protein